jgi:hypothetical protein
MFEVVLLCWEGSIDFDDLSFELLVVKASSFDELQ